MNTKLIEKAYEHFKGVWPEGYTALAISTSKNLALGGGKYDNYKLGKKMFDRSCGNPSHWLWVCTQAEFEEYAKTHNKPEINWDEAPEGATACHKPKYPRWMKKNEIGDIYVYIKCMDKWLKYVNREAGVKDYNDSIKKPHPWSPEVGETCEVSWYGSWQQTFIVGKDSDGDLVYETTGFSESGHFEVADSSTEFRPIRKETMLYDNIGEGVLCWVLDKSGKEVPEFVTVYEEGKEYPFGRDCTLTFKLVKPLTKEEALQYVYGERKDK